MIIAAAHIKREPAIALASPPREPGAGWVIVKTSMLIPPMPF
jgi:hypothetical protein